MQRELEDYLRGKAQKIVAEIVGANNLRVQVSAAMSFDQIQRTTDAVDPDKQVVAAEQKAEIVPGAQGGAGQNNTSTTYENSKSTESFVSAPGTVKRLTVAVLVADHPAPAGSKAQPTPRSAAELAQIATLVRSAIGADSTRGDVVSVVSVPFEPTIIPAPTTPKTDMTRVIETAQRPLLGILGLVLIIVVALLSLKSLRQTAHSGSPVMMLPRGDMQQTALAMQPAPPLMMPTDGVRNRVASSIEQQPDVAARVVRAWLKEA